MFKARGLFYHSTLGLRVIQKKGEFQAQNPAGCEKADCSIEAMQLSGTRENAEMVARTKKRPRRKSSGGMPKI